MERIKTLFLDWRHELKSNNHCLAQWQGGLEFSTALAPCSWKVIIVHGKRRIKWWIWPPHWKRARQGVSFIVLFLRHFMVLLVTTNAAEFAMKQQIPPLVSVSHTISMFVLSKQQHPKPQHSKLKETFLTLVAQHNEVSAFVHACHFSQSGHRIWPTKCMHSKVRIHPWKAVCPYPHSSEQNGRTCCLLTLNDSHSLR